VQTRGVRALESVQGARLQPAVIPHERAVEIGRDDAQALRERCRKLDQPFGFPPDALTT
jgi:hypothetical protein